MQKAESELESENLLESQLAFARRVPWIDIRASLVHSCESVTFVGVESH